jgi:hypothetical protein
MSDAPVIVIRLDGDSGHHRPGETLSGQYWIESPDASQVKAVEASVLWYTEGKGDEDMAVHEFWRRDASDAETLDARRPEPFSATLPNSPLSYHGHLITIRWCVRVRVFTHRGKDLVSERAFLLGEVPAAKEEGGH